MRSKYNQSNLSNSDKPSMTTTITNRLYEPPPKMSTQRDFFGNRSHFLEETSSLELK
jgi:hypothetical protein